jgi:hypothetical protein
MLHRVDTDQPTTPDARHAALVVRCTTHSAGTLLDLATDDGISTVRIDRLPDVAAAEAARRVLRTVQSVRFDIDDRGVACTLRGVDHRQPRAVPVSLATGLGLVKQGLLALVVRHGEH